MSELSQVVVTSPQGAFYSRLPIRNEMTIRDLLTVMSRRRGIVWSTMLAVVALGVVVCLTSTRLYRATAVVQVQKEPADALSLNNMIVQSGGDQDAIESNLTLQTEAKVLESESLALKVIKALNLENTPDFQPRFSPIGWILGYLTPSGPQDSGDKSLDDARRHNRSVSIFASRLKVKPVTGTRLISVEYLSPNPQTAAAVVNELIGDLTDFNFETKHGATQQATKWLAKQMSDLRKESEDLQAKVVELQHGSGMFTAGQTDSEGKEQVYTPALEKLQMATSQLGDAQSARIMKGALYQVVKNGDPELISGLAGNSTLTGSSPGIAGSLTLLQNLRSQEAKTQAQLDELSAKFGPAYPKLAEVEASLKGTQEAIAEESARVAKRVKNDYLVSQQVENNDRALFQQEKEQAESLNDKAVEYDIVRQEAAQSRNLYESLFSRLKEADLVAGLRSSNITVVDSARIPTRPARPNVPIYLAASIAVGLVLAICAGLLRDAADYSIQEIAELKSFGQNLPVGLLPYYPGPTAGQWSWLTPAYRIVAAAEPRAAYTEALRTLRTVLLHSSQGERSPQVVLITSSIPGEGKSMLSINLAAVYAQDGKKVLLVDADLRTPVLEKRLGLSSSGGLSDLLVHANANSDPHRPVRVSLASEKFFDVVPSGPLPEYPAELLGSEAMTEAIEQWRRNYDYIFIDGAPLLPVTDSALLSSYADYTLVVARHKLTDRRSLEKTYHILQLQGVRHLGIVLNAVKATGAAQYRYYGYELTPYEGNTYVG